MKPKTSLVFLLLVITAAITTLSCDKDDNKDDTNNAPKSKTELLTTGRWKRTLLISNPAYDWYANGISDTNVLSILKPCELDNFDVYTTNGIYELNEGPTKCDASFPQTWTLRWTFTDNETKLVFDATDVHDVYDLLELTATSLRMRITFVENGVTYTHEEAYEH